MHSSPLNHPSGRTFLKQSAVALGVPFAAPQILAQSVAGANDKLNIAWTNRPKSGWGFNGNVMTEFPKAEPPPQGMDWDLWLGPCLKKASGDQQVAKTLPRTRGIQRDWLEAIKNGRKSCSDFSYSGPLTEAILLGSLAIRTGKTLKRDAQKLEITGNPEAAKMINPEAREGWRPKDLA